MVVDLTQLLQLGVNGVVLGSILALAAVGLTLVYGILDLANFAHGDLATLGAYLALAFTTVLTLPVTLRWGLAVAAALLLGVVADRWVRDPVASAVDRVDEKPALSRQEAGILVYASLLILALVAGLVLEAPIVGTAGFAAAIAVAVVGLLGQAWQLRIHEEPDALRDMGLGLLAAPIAAAVLVYGLGPLAGWGISWSFALGLGLLVPAVSLVRRRRGLVGEPVAKAGLALGGLVAAWTSTTPLLLAITLALILVGAFTMALDLLIWRPMRSRDAGLLTLIIISIGLALAVRNGVIITWGTGVVDFPGAGSGPLQLIPGVLITQTQLVVIGVTLVAIGLVHVLLRHTAMGKAMRALADDVDLARITGVDVDRIILYVWFISGALAALAGVLVGLLRPFTTSVGWFLLLPIFAAVILGGIGSPYGAMAGGFVIGITMETSLAFGVPSDYRLAVGFGIMILVLVFRPQGIFGGQATR
jgi:neutral amino acid transport system permease protein